VTFPKALEGLFENEPTVDLGAHVGKPVEEIRVFADHPYGDPGYLTAAEADASRAYRDCPLGMHAPGEPHHYSCWAEFL
jgi:hypothetical protein